jgi:hypothetical protein
MKKIVVYYVGFVFFYIILIFLTSPFLLTWGRERNIFEKMYVYFLSKPFDLELSPLFLPVNGAFWATIFYLLYWEIQRFREGRGF